jgi:hypothetical protein
LRISISFLQTGVDPLGVLMATALGAQLILLAFPKLHRVDLRQLPTVELFLAGDFACLVAKT